MMRQEVLEVLELLPVWQLRKPLPQQEVLAEKDVVEHTQAESQPKIVAEVSPEVICYDSDDGRLILMHLSEELDEKKQLLLQNIATAIKMKRPALKKTLHTIKEQQADAVVILFGQTLAQLFLSTDQTLNELREQVHVSHGMQVVVTEALDAVIAQTELKKVVWRDCCLAMKQLAEV